MAGVVARSVLADQVRDHLLEGILSGRYPPDSRIVETQVARDLGTSQAPVREALRALEGIGVVEIAPFRGARVRRPTRRELLGAYSVRAALEVLGARLAVPRLTEADLDELVEYGRVMEEAARAGDGRAVAEADATFHGRIVALADN
ncbi:MAG TPA: GntR family transcriptional regulator, partial [Candidatus Sulfotelmatobacter sp.]|nr:GntR family transcriptional regulator [Candidatus Sulfotelmatobacter sp.]